MSDDTTAITFFNGLYDETMTLLVEARAYALHAYQQGYPGSSGLGRLTATYELMRVTSRLTQVMAWLLAQKAVHAGEMDRATAAAAYGLGAQSLCLAVGGEEDPELPSGVRSLLERSRNLYRRVSRLDEMVQAHEGAA